MEYVRVERDGHTALLTIDRQEKLNALNAGVQTEIIAALGELEDEDHRALIITGAGERSFVAGADINAMRGRTPMDVKRSGMLGREMNSRIENHPAPTIAAVNGFALGGGSELALACDIRIASENARFGFPEVGLGILPGAGGTQRLPRLIGPGLAKELIFTGRRISAQEAKELGIVNRVVPEGEAVEAARELAREISKNGPVAVRFAKMSMNHGADLHLARAIEYESDQFALLFATEDVTEGMSAFAEKRSPEFEGS